MIPAERQTEKDGEDEGLINGGWNPAAVIRGMLFGMKYLFKTVKLLKTYFQNTGYTQIIKPRTGQAAV